MLAGAAAAAMRLVEHDQISLRQLHGFRADAADKQRVDRRDLHRLHGPWLNARHDDAVAYTVRRELAARLEDDLAAVGEEQHALVALDRALNPGFPG